MTQTLIASAFGFPFDMMAAMNHRISRTPAALLRSPHGRSLDVRVPGDDFHPECPAHTEGRCPHCGGLAGEPCFSFTDWAADGALPGAQGGRCAYLPQDVTGTLQRWDVISEQLGPDGWRLVYYRSRYGRRAALEAVCGHGRGGITVGARPVHVQGELGLSGEAWMVMVGDYVRYAIRTA